MFPPHLPRHWRTGGVDIVTTQAAENTGNTDHDQLLYAKEENRVLMTHNIKDFILIHQDFFKNNRTHPGIIVSDQLRLGPF